MITIRLKKKFSNKNLSFSIIAVFSTTAPTSGKLLEKIGFYRPIVDVWCNKYVFMDVDRLLFWIKRGAKLNNSVFLIARPLLITIIKL